MTMTSSAHVYSLLYNGTGSSVGQLGCTINKTIEFRHRTRLGQQADDDDDDGGEEECPQRAEDILGHRLGIGRKRHVGQRRRHQLDPHEQAG